MSVQTLGRRWLARHSVAPSDQRSAMLLLTPMMLSTTSLKAALIIVWLQTRLQERDNQLGHFGERT